MAQLNSLLLVEEKILEAENFARRLRALNGENFTYEFNAFLSAARSVTFLLQKEMRRVPGFKEWWVKRRKKMREDAGMKYFLELRNFSQKEGRVSLVGTTSKDCEGNLLWSYRFAGNKQAVPKALLHRDVVDCCLEHLGKLARIVLKCANAFPNHSCPRRTVATGGFKFLDLKLSDIVSMLGFPIEWVSTVKHIPENEVYRILGNHFDGVDFENIRRVASYTPENVGMPSTPSEYLNKELARALVNRIERGAVEVSDALNWVADGFSPRAPRDGVAEHVAQHLMTQVRRSAFCARKCGRLRQCR
ncbi:hypothetical protein [Candidatus Foliamicus sp.]